MPRCQTKNQALISTLVLSAGSQHVHLLEFQYPTLDTRQKTRTSHRVTRHKPNLRRAAGGGTLTLTHRARPQEPSMSCSVAWP